jgi:acetoin:2,6-dichlorophenolindophenol oxidoreductase subunit beta
MSEATVVPAAAELTYLEAVNAALRWALLEYPEALVFGEDVALPGGPYGASKGLHREFGPCVFDTPISETAMLGAAIGAAMRGRRPIVEIMFADFFFVAFDQVVNPMSNIHYVSRGGFRLPLTIRSQQAVVPGACAQHTHASEAFLAHVPGLRVGLAADPHQAYEMLRAAIASDDPVIVLETRALYPTRAAVALDGAVQPVGGAGVVRRGRHLTIVSWSRMVGEAFAAAEALAAERIEAEVVDLRWLSPLDLDTVVGSVEHTNRLLIAHEAPRTGGFGGEIAARIADVGFDLLDAPIRRVALADVPIPAAPHLQAAVVPDVTTIATAARDLLAS